VLYTIPAGTAVLISTFSCFQFQYQGELVMMVPAYVAQKLNQLNRHRKKLIHELFFIVSMENNKDTELLEFVFPNISDSKKPHCHPLSLASYHLEDMNILHIFNQKVIAFGFICLVQKTMGSRNTIWNWSEVIC
jgi:hypothetical protein